MQAKLEVMRGAKTREICLRLPSVICRGGDSKVKLPASTVSRHHCEIYEHDGQIVVRDLGSSNGTLVNGHKIKGPTFLTPEDEVTIGPLTARISPMPAEEEAIAEATTAPSQEAMAEASAEASAEVNAEPVAEAPMDYPVAPAEEAAPSLEELPAEQEKPVFAAELVEEPTTDDDAEDDDSVLQYAEPKSSGRSFVGIVPSEDAAVQVSDVPVFDDPKSNPKPEVSSEDSALNSFFESLDE